MPVTVIYDNEEYVFGHSPGVRRVVEGRGVQSPIESWLAVVRAPLPVQVEPVEVGGWQPAAQLQLGQQREVVRGDVRVRAAQDVIVKQPLRVQGPEKTERIELGS